MKLQVSSNNPLAVGCSGLFLVAIGLVFLLSANTLRGIPTALRMLVGSKATATAEVTHGLHSSSSGGSKYRSGTATYGVSYQFRKGGLYKGYCLTNRRLKKGDQAQVIYLESSPRFNRLRYGFLFSFSGTLWGFLFVGLGAILFRWSRRIARASDLAAA